MLAENRSISDNLKDDEDSTQHQNHQHRPKQFRSESQPEDEHEQFQKNKREEGGGKVRAHFADEEEEDSEREEKEEEKAEKELKQRARDERDEAEDYERSPYSSSSSEKPEFVFVELSKIRNDVQCPICLGVIKKTRTVMECLHRFCRECIDKSMRLGNNECPACRTHCASRRSLRDDPNHDALIAALYPDIDKYEEEELAFHEEERTRNKQIQESIALIFQRQSEALVKRRTVRKDISDAHMTRTQWSHRNAHSRRRNSQGVELQGSEDNDGEHENNNIGKGSSSTEDHRVEFRKRKRKKRAGVRSIQPSSSVNNSERGFAESDLEISHENRVISHGLAWNSEMLAWGKGGVRSHTRHGNANSSSSKIPRNSRLSKLIDYLWSLKENADELDIHLMLISLDKSRTPDLQKPHLCCHSSLSVKHLCEFVACQTLLRADEIELLTSKGVFQVDSDQSNPKIATTMNYPDMVSLVTDQFRGDMQILKAEETLEGIRANCTSFKDQMILAYRRKDSCE